MSVNDGTFEVNGPTGGPVVNKVIYLQPTVMHLHHLLSLANNTAVLSFMYEKINLYRETLTFGACQNNFLQTSNHLRGLGFYTVVPEPVCSFKRPDLRSKCKVKK